MIRHAALFAAVQAAELCQTPLCDYGRSASNDQEAPRCVARRAVLLELIDPGSPFRELATAGDRCSAVLETDTGHMLKNATLCNSAVGCIFNTAHEVCEPSLDGLMTIATQSIRLDSSRCGVLGLLTERGAQCLPHRDKDSCEYFAEIVPESHCAWFRGRCDVSPIAAREMTAMHQGEIYQMQIAQKRCQGRPPELCARPCRFDAQLAAINGTEAGCVPSELEPLLILAGRGCPYTDMLLGEATCRARSKELCTLSTRADGLPDCELRNGYCMPDLVAIEADVFRSPGAAKAQSECYALAADKKACRVKCADDLLANYSVPSVEPGLAVAASVLLTVLVVD